MTRTLILEDFNDATPPTEFQTSDTFSPAPAPPGGPAEGVPPDAEAGGLDAFEQGYQSGWDDCIANETEERRRIEADLGAALSAISLSTETIRAELLSSIAPVLEEIATQLLPQLAADAVAPLLINEITEIVAAHRPVALTLLAAPDKCASIEAMIQTATDTNVTVVPEPAFAEGQVSIRFADQRRDIDLSDAVARMSDILRAFAADQGRGAGPSTQNFERGVA